jgi:hypothetical protein
MIKNAEIFEKFEKEYAVRESLSFQEASRIFESLWNEGVSLGVLPLKDPFEGLEVDFRIARILNSCSKSSSQD